jgi:hypothetical protein
MNTYKLIGNDEISHALQFYPCIMICVFSSLVMH